MAWGIAWCAGSILPAVAAAQTPQPLGESSLLRIGLLELGSGEPPWPKAATTLAAEIRARTSVEPAGETVRLRIADARLFSLPLLVLAGDRAFALPPPADLLRLRRHLTYGGMLVLDDTAARPGGAFDTSARALLRALFPDATPTPVRSDHVLYKSFYLTAGAAGRAGVSPTLEAVERDGRIVALLSPNDLGGGLASGDERSLRLGINVVFYALCLDYKDDQVHLPFILRRRHWRPEP